MEQIQAGGGVAIFALCIIGFLIAAFILAVVGIFRPIVVKILFEEYPSLKNLTEAQVRRICSVVLVAFIAVVAFGFLTGGLGRIAGFLTIIAFLSLFLLAFSFGVMGLVSPARAKRVFVVFGDKINYSLTGIRIICVCLVIVVVFFAKIILWSQQ